MVCQMLTTVLEENKAEEKGVAVLNSGVRKCLAARKIFEQRCEIRETMQQALAQCLPQNRDRGFCILTITTIVFKYQSHSSYFLEKTANTELVETTQNIDIHTSTNGDSNNSIN